MYLFQPEPRDKDSPQIPSDDPNFPKKAIVEVIRSTLLGFSLGYFGWVGFSSFFNNIQFSVPLSGIIFGSLSLGGTVRYGTHLNSLSSVQFLPLPSIEVADIAELTCRRGSQRAHAGGNSAKERDSVILSLQKVLSSACRDVICTTPNITHENKNLTEQE